MEGLRKGSLFPFLETGRGEESGSRFPLHPAEPGRKALCRYPAPVFSCRSRPFGEVTYPFPGCGLHRPVSLLLQILLASREQMGYLPLRAARCAMPESPVGPRPCGACRTGDSCRSCSGAALFFTHGATIRCPILRIHAGMPRQDWRRHDSGTPWKERIFRP